MKNSDNYLRAAGQCVERLLDITGNKDLWSSPSGASNSASAISALIDTHNKLVDHAGPAAPAVEKLRKFTPGTAKDLATDEQA